MMEIIRVTRGEKSWIYPKLQAEGNASQWCKPFAKKLLTGNGLDIGYNREEWMFIPEDGYTLGIEPSIDPEWHAMNLPDNPEPGSDGKWDFIYSSHCLEHIKESWGVVLNYWKSKLRKGGVLFLYLPGPEQQYWKNWSNTKHVHNLVPDQLKEYFEQNGWLYQFVTGEDLNNSFYAVGQL